MAFMATRHVRLDLIDQVKVLRPTRHKQVISEMFFLANLLEYY